MFFETYQVSREFTERLLNEIYHPCREEIIKNNRDLEDARLTMHITKLPNGSSVEFDDLDLSFLDTPQYVGSIFNGLVQIDWESDTSNTKFLLGSSSFIAA